MTDFTLHTLESAPEAAKPLLKKSQQDFGMIPNLHAVMAESPEALEAYQQLHRLFTQSSLNKDELTVVWQTINRAHNCHYCLPAHSLVAQMMGVNSELNDDVKNGKVLANAKLETLRVTTLAMVEQRGNLSAEQTEAFYQAGYSNQDMLAIILGMAQKVMSNFTNHIANTPVDDAFKKYI
ncbi:carboxymuconolactone decarboxylase family protein [Planctobacterium marinum]|uniref:carboxymuconolactone decarboxylase family protein n=1 Tax=Planctobacterium marinum TaxID=1631968 RepID=UPI001E4F1164|nr:carboxymuconolactone decarboxylase family protein [Planctobacterium marinum]MCC2604210.1 carboxymuconolactone decarboxylase family protein [Planctobacterium marinum]